MLHRVGFVVSFSSNIELWFHKWFPQSCSTNHCSKQVLIGLALGVEGRPPAPLNLVTFSQFFSHFISTKILLWKLRQQKLAFSLAELPHHHVISYNHDLTSLSDQHILMLSGAGWGGGGGRSPRLCSLHPLRPGHPHWPEVGFSQKIVNKCPTIIFPFVQCYLSELW